MKVKQLLERYNLKTRQSLYDRLKALGITLAKNDLGHNYATPEQIELLDELNEHLQKPGSTLANFTPVTKTEIAPVDSTVDTRIDRQLDIREDTQIDTQIDNRLEVLMGAIAARMQPPSLLWHNKELEEAAEKGWLLTTAEVRQLISVKPKTSKGEKVYKRGCWLFQKAGKIGSQTAWRVSKSVNEADN